MDLKDLGAVVLFIVVLFGIITITIMPVVLAFTYCGDVLQVLSICWMGACVIGVIVIFADY